MKLFLSMLSLLFYLLAGHALADFGLQSDWVAKHKDYHVAPDIWVWVLSAHALIHGLMVALITGYPLLGIAEALVHWVIDYAKCDGHTNFHQDQALHILCKLAWTAVILFP